MCAAPRLWVVAALLIGAVACVGPARAETPRAPAPQVPAPQAPAPQQSPGEAVPGTLEQKAKLLESLYGRLATAASAEQAEPIAQSIEKLWAYSGSATADLLVERSVAAVQSDRRDLALELLDATVELQPDFAEAWNRRAYVYYLANDYQRALGDLRRVLALEPNHFKALDGLARILREIGEKKGAFEAYKRLLAVHPNAAGARQAVDELKLEVEGQGI
jgi:tetratricopeptide (TPR) repeat protein